MSKTIEATPGPFYSDEEAQASSSATAGVYVYNSKDVVVGMARCRSNGIDDEEAAINARHFAAAPDMLMGLTMLYEACVELNRLSPRTIDHKIMFEAKWALDHANGKL